MRTGLLAKKLGITRIFGDAGKHIPVTLFQIAGNQVITVRTEEKDGYNAIQVGFGERKLSRTSKPQKTVYAKKGLSPKQHLKEFRVSKENLLKEGDIISPAHFIVGQKVDVSGITVGKGFQGVMKRWNFAGLEASHGVSISHRSHGSTGQRQDPGRTFKNKKMAGHMGASRITTQNLKVVIVDEGAGIIGVAGNTQGFEGAILEIKDAVKAPASYKDAPKPAKLVEGGTSGQQQQQQQQ